MKGLHTESIQKLFMLYKMPIMGLYSITFAYQNTDKMDRNKTKLTSFIKLFRPALLLSINHYFPLTCNCRHVSTLLIEPARLTGYINCDYTVELHIHSAREIYAIQIRLSLESYTKADNFL